MVKITAELVRKRAEHNDGDLATLREVALHQYDIEKIENLAQICRHLEILYLQNNLISRIENLGKLKELEYLNLAVNNITRVEGLEGCESLRKLDLTVNFVADFGSVESLAGLEFLEELFLTGNPCTKLDYYRPFVIAAVPQLRRLDGDEITKSERIQALQAFEGNRARMLENRARIEEEERAKRGAVSASGKRVDEKGEEVFGHSPEERMRLHREVMERREASRPDDEKPRPAKLIPDAKVPDLGKDGRVLNRNEGKYEFSLSHSDDGKYLVIDLHVGRYVDTSFIDVDLQPKYVRVVSKGKVFQLVLDDEIHPDQSKAERSITTGVLCLKCRLVRDAVLAVGGIQDGEGKAAGVADDKNGGNAGDSDGDVEGKVPRGSLTDAELERAAERAKAPDYEGIVADKDGSGNNTTQVPLGARISSHVVEKTPGEDFVDDDDVPPLE